MNCECFIQAYFTFQNCQKSISNDSALLIDADLSVLNTDSENEDSADEEIKKVHNIVSI